MDDEGWNATTFSKNRDRLLRGEIAEEFFAGSARFGARPGVVVGRTFHRERHDGRRLGSLKSFQPKDESARNDNDKPDGRMARAIRATGGEIVDETTSDRRLRGVIEVFESFVIRKTGKLRGSAVVAAGDLSKLQTR